MTTPCRLLIDEASEGPRNMAVDELLLDLAAGGTASLRFYQWSKPTLSLGYFQPYAERQLHLPSRGAPVVRRLSGGGTLLHDRELTYSLCLPPGSRFAQQHAAVYGIVHQALIEQLRLAGVEAALVRDLPPAEVLRDDAFLCFVRRSPDDVVLRTATGATVKVAGSAQRRRRGAILQHGGVLLRSSALAPELLGISEVANCRIDPAVLADSWSSALGVRLELDFCLDQADLHGCQEQLDLLVAKYNNPEWTQRR